MRPSLLLALILCTAASSVAVAADNETRPDNATGATATAKTAPDWCANDTCPVDGKPLNKDIKTSSFHPANGPKSPDQAVGFCCDDCRTAYESNPAKYEKDLGTQIQRRREARNPKAN